MEEKGFNQIRLIVALIGLAMLVFLGLSATIPVVDLCILGLGLTIIVLFSNDMECVPWAVGFTVFYMIFLFLGYHCPLLVWDAPDVKMLEEVAVYGNKLVILLVNAFFYFLGVVAVIFLIAGVFSGFHRFNNKDSLLK